MPDFQHVLQYVGTAGFCLLTVITLVDWLKYRGPSRGYLALAVGLLGVVSLMSQFSSLASGPIRMVMELASLVGFMAAGYALLLFRDSLIPLRRRTKVAVGVVVTVSTLLTAVFVVDPALPKSAALATGIGLIVVWMLTVIEPIFRLWRVSRGRPAVQRARLRSLSLGYGGIVLLLVLAIVAAPLENNPIYGIGLGLLELAVIPLLYVAFAPPRLLRRIWRQREEGALSEAVRELLLFSPDRPTLARRALEWAVRLVGADGGLMADAGGEVLYAAGLEPEVQDELVAELKSGHRRVIDLGSSRSAMVVPWELDARRGGLAVVSGPFTPLFGADEMTRLDQYAAAIKAALDRVRLVESIRENQEQLKQFNQELERRVAKRTAQLEASNHELEAFSYTVSHDLRAPLRAIDGFSRILLDEQRPQLTEDGQHYVDMISENAEDMGRLIDGLLTFSRLTRQEMKAQWVLPGDVVGPVVDRLMASANGRHIEFEVKDMPPCRSDLMLLQQVYANLLGNAVKFSRDRDPARIEVGALTQEGEAGKTIYYVKDNGVGFDMRYVDKLFGVFQRLHRSDEFEGTGAGLAIVQRIVHRHGGEVWAQSTPGQGATFYFTLGAEEEEVALPAVHVGD